MSTRSATLAQTATSSPAGPRSNGQSQTPKGSKVASKGNGSILNFFKKADSQVEDSLFISHSSPPKPTLTQRRAYTSFDESIDSTGSPQQAIEQEARYQELGASVKRRKTSASPIRREPSPPLPAKEAAKTFDKRGCTPPPADFDDERNPVGDIDGVQSDGGARGEGAHKGPFLDDSDSEDEDNKPGRDVPVRMADTGRPTEPPAGSQSLPPREAGPEHEDADRAHSPADRTTEDAEPPRLKRESTSWPEQNDFADMEGMGDFDDEYEDGEEFVERRWVQEQNRLELIDGYEGEMKDEYDAADIKDEPADETQSKPSDDPPADSVATCPCCNASFAGVSDQEASVHVNHCLDGNPTPLPTTSTQTTPKPRVPTKKESTPTSDPKPPTFRGPDRPAKPGQQNPFQLTTPNKPMASSSSSAFSTLMSSHSEETAWASAAAAERASHGKPSYQRTCPFYKILPGLSICVDAFRYGAVQGCNAYFLSHFHSDHYVGLTASWRHGPIYCSGVTGRLVKQQLRVDPKWVVELDFEKSVKVPNTDGVVVTMIPANHCPGSSLYLFESTLPPTTKNGKKRTHRILHCGDFRACPAHLAHPLLAPEVVDKVTGKIAHQKIDVCYLDTTYLNPKYAFPSQEDVIQACADMCVSLNKEKVDESDKFEAMKREKMGGSMVKFVRQDSKDEDSPAVDGAVAKHTGNNNPLPPRQTAIETSLNPPPTTSTTTTTISNPQTKPRGRLLIIVGTYSIGKERICLGIARALGTKIYAPPPKQRICAALRDPELSALLTTDPLAAQVHMTPLFEIRADTLADYLDQYPREVFARAVAFRPSGWNYRPPGGRSTDAPNVNAVLYFQQWKSRYSIKDLVPQRGSSARAACFGVPYSEHSSFRELSMFVCGLRIGRVVPTVNVGSAVGRERMRGWCERWEAEKRKGGLFRVAKEGEGDEVGKDGERRGEWYPGMGTWELRTTL